MYDVSKGYTMLSQAPGDTQTDALGHGETAGHEDALLAAFLRERAGYCPRCKYNLRNLMGNQCPECGTQIVLDLHARHKLDRTWVIGVVLLAGHAGFWLINLVFLTLSDMFYAMFIGRSAFQQDWEYQLTALVSAICTSLLLLVWLFTHRLIALLATSWRVGLILLWLLLPILSIIMLLLFF